MDVAPIQAERRRRFLSPAHVLKLGPDHTWQARGVADTPTADAVCELYLAVDAGRIIDVAFALYGPPVAIACADWLCETAVGRTIAAARGLSEQEWAQDMEHALALAADERYAAMLAIDALASALLDLGS